VSRVLFDMDVILDALLPQPAFSASSTRALDTTSGGVVTGLVSGHAVPTLYYILRKEVGDSQARARLSALLGRLSVAPVTEAAIRVALASPFSDFEDAVTHAVAVEAGADRIVTRNLSDYRGGSIPAVLPDTLLTP
jgi:predicted nucleic acid-binding protein